MPGDGLANTTAKKAEYYKLNSDKNAWEVFYFATSADLVLETTSYKRFTVEEQTAISTYLSEFNTSNKLVKLDGDGEISTSLIPDLSGSYIPKKGGEVTGSLAVNDVLRAKKILTVVGTTAPLILGNIDKEIEISGAGLDVKDSHIINVKTPITNHSAANKAYVDAQMALGAKPKEAVKVYWNEDAPNLQGDGFEIDGITVNVNDRVLVKGHGIYQVQSGSWVKAPALDNEKGAYVFVMEGNSYNNWYFHHGASGWIPHGKPETVGAEGALAKNANNNIIIKNSGVTNAMIAGDIDWGKISSATLSEGTKWDDVGSSVLPRTLKQRINDFATAIKLLRFGSGGVSFGSSSTQSIKGAYELANQKTQIYSGSSLPTNYGDFNAGDVFLKTY